jgi:hypothetical protein
LALVTTKEIPKRELRELYNFGGQITCFQPVTTKEIPKRELRGLFGNPAPQ